MSDKKIKDGGPAFPSKRVERRHFDNDPRRDMVNVDVYETGLSLRDYFAAKVLPEIYRQYADQANAKNQWDPGWKMYLAVDSYRMADAMIDARDLSTTSDT